MLVCSKCGFVAFLEGRAELEAAGWLVDDHPDGTVVLCCPACRTDDVCDQSVTGAARDEHGA
jgi:hypothetical protein